MQSSVWTVSLVINVTEKRLSCGQHKLCLFSLAETQCITATQS